MLYSSQSHRFCNDGICNYPQVIYVAGYVAYGIRNPRNLSELFIKMPAALFEADRNIEYACGAPRVWCTACACLHLATTPHDN